MQHSQVITKSLAKKFNKITRALIWCKKDKVCCNFSEEVHGAEKSPKKKRAKCRKHGVYYQGSYAMKDKNSVELVAGAVVAKGTASVILLFSSAVHLTFHDKTEK